MTIKTILNNDVTVFVLVIASFLLPILFVEYSVLRFTGGIFSYPQDDTFIHLAISKNLAFNGVWGINAHEFSSASSSILYPIILMISLKLFGAHTIIPFLLNLLAGIIFLMLLQKWMKRQNLQPTSQFFVFFCVIFFTPLPVLVICGMEHTFELLFCFLFIYNFSDSIGNLTNSDKTECKLPPSVFVYGAILTAIRYEGIPIVFVACLILLTRKKLFLSFLLAITALLPVVIFGFFSLAKGNYFLPNSVLLKSGGPSLDPTSLFTFFTRSIFGKLSFSPLGTYNIKAVQSLLFILLFSYLLLIDQIRKFPTYRYILIFLISAILFHLSFTGYAWFPRYEAYLVGCSVIIIGTLTVKYGQGLLAPKITLARWIVTFSSSILLFPLILRSRDIFHDIAQASINVYEQQYQMGLFLHDHYDKDPIAIGDIGAVSYFTTGKNLDLVGLGNMDVAKSKRGFYYTPDFLNKLIEKYNVKIAVVYDYFNSPDLLRRWNKAATWQILNNVACGDDIISFYAVSPAFKPDLLKNLQDFQKFLPADVSVKYY